MFLKAILKTNEQLGNSYFIIKWIDLIQTLNNLKIEKVIMNIFPILILPVTVIRFPVGFIKR